MLQIHTKKPTYLVFIQMQELLHCLHCTLLRRLVAGPPPTAIPLIPTNNYLGNPCAAVGDIASAGVEVFHLVLHSQGNVWCNVWCVGPTG